MSWSDVEKQVDTSVKSMKLFLENLPEVLQVHPKYHNESTNSNLYIFASVSFQSAKPQKSKELGKKNDLTCLSFLSFFSTQTNPVAFLSKRLRLFLFLHIFIVFVFYGSYFSMVTCNLSIITF